MKTLTAERLTAERHLNLFRVAFRDRLGNRKDWILASRRPAPVAVSGPPASPDAVVIVPFHRRRDRLVMIRQYRVALGGEQYEFPAGLVDAGETVEETARRELREETGLRVERVLRSGPTVSASAGVTDETVAMVFVECDGEPSTGGNEGSEEIEVLLLDRSQAAALCDDSSARFDAKAWLVLSAYARWGRL